MKLKIIRQIDELGRVVIPKDLREQYGLKPGKKIYFEACNDGILLHREGNTRGNDNESIQEN